MATKKFGGGKFHPQRFPLRTFDRDGSVGIAFILNQFLAGLGGPF